MTNPLLVTPFGALWKAATASSSRFSAAARSALATENPELLLLDVVMPGEDGLAFLKWLRSEGNELPVLMVSALDTAKPAVEALQFGAADYLVKGFELEELRTRVGIS